MAQGQKQDSRRHPRTGAAKSADKTGFKPVALPAAMNAASSKPPRPKGHHGGFWMLHEDALIG